MPTLLNAQGGNTLGTYFMSHFDIELNYPARQVRFAPRPDQKQFAIPGESGIRLDVNDEDASDGWRVGNVYTDMPGIRTGIEPGDRILSIRGRSVQTLQRSVAQDALHGFAGDTVTITFQKPDERSDRKTVTGTYASASAISVPFSQIPSLGCRLSRNLQDHLFIGSVEEGSPAQKSGLREDDRVLSLNGERVERLSMVRIARILAETRHKPLIIVVARSGKEHTIRIEPPKD
ncbi:MAG: hypothetical protein OHK0029_24650 [Armatimonadaceae bacterium]